MKLSPADQNTLEQLLTEASRGYAGVFEGYDGKNNQSLDVGDSTITGIVQDAIDSVEENPGKPAEARKLLIRRIHDRANEFLDVVRELGG